MWSVESLQRELTAGRTSSRELVEQALARIADPAGEGARTFMKVHAESARADADHADRLRKSGVRRSAVDGLPISVKDLYDIAGDVTRAGSKVLAGAPAAADAPAVASLRAAGAGDRGPQQHGGVRFRRGRHQPPLRHAEESLG
jgi:aspartyl-tRNA(Asn)/glutamyl-tRNA(Gln) amidotransferase subunit A